MVEQLRKFRRPNKLSEKEIDKVIGEMFDL